ncbi:hypothetical protein [Streptomyces sp. NBC_01601]|uniref:hypothetical protein n=1 Tax=Streptomyces sp. NBC_01601 TaxID=2975892 RepID=UPI002E29D39B|nr:hypothetical protein [Streptomyces sp. NBC_01601]
MHRYRAGDTVRILHPHHYDETREVACLLDGLLFFSGVDGGIWPAQVELVSERPGNPCGTQCEHSSCQTSCEHCRGLCQQPYGRCPPREGEEPAVVFMGPRW